MLRHPPKRFSDKQKAKWLFAKGILVQISKGVRNEAAIAKMMEVSRQRVHYDLKNSKSVVILTARLGNDHTSLRSPNREGKLSSTPTTTVEMYCLLISSLFIGCTIAGGLFQ